MEEPLHIPVMVREVLNLLKADRGGLFVDCTLGMGGHSMALLEASPESLVIGLDRDAEGQKLATERLSAFGERFKPVHCDYRDIETWGMELVGREPDGILCDLGFSRGQLARGRGFSFGDREALDMRMDRSAGEPASAFVNGGTDRELEEVFRAFGEERNARRVAREIVSARAINKIETAAALAEIVSRAFPERVKRTMKIHPATRVFQALRIRTNMELEGLGDFFIGAFEKLKTGGRLLIIAYHSLEDRIAKEALASLTKGCICPPKLPVCGCGRKPVAVALSKGAIKADGSEVVDNPSARGARLRAVEKL